MLRVGLTGGIGSGKSALAGRLADRGAVVIDADALARRALAPGSPAVAAVAAAFGAEVVPGGVVDRAALARLVFADRAALERLAAIVHPVVARETEALVARAAERDPAAVVVEDVPLLVEAGLAARYDAVVVVRAAAETRLARLVAGRGMSPADARARMAAQATDAERAAVADWVIDNDGPPAALDGQADRLWQELRRRADRIDPAGPSGPGRTVKG